MSKAVACVAASAAASVAALLVTLCGYRQALHQCRCCSCRCCSSCCCYVLMAVRCSPVAVAAGGWCTAAAGHLAVYGKFFRWIRLVVDRLFRLKRGRLINFLRSARSLFFLLVCSYRLRADGRTGLQKLVKELCSMSVKNIDRAH